VTVPDTKLARRTSIGVELDLAAIGRVPEPVEVAGITSSPRRAPTRPGRRTPRSCASPPRSEATASVCRSATTARGAPIRPAARAWWPPRPGGGPGRVSRGEQPSRRRDVDPRPASAAAPL